MIRPLTAITLAVCYCLSVCIYSVAAQKNQQMKETGRGELPHRLAESFPSYQAPVEEKFWEQVAEAGFNNKHHHEAIPAFEKILERYFGFAPSAISRPLYSAGRTTFPAVEKRKSRKPDLGRELNVLLSRYSEYGFSGTVLVAKDGKILLHRGFGLADRDRNLANTTKSIYPLASVTKTYTAAAILKLEMEGKLKITDKIDKYLGTIPSALEGITIEQLLTHTSGLIRDDSGQISVSDRDGFIRSVMQTSPEFPPGRRYSYSNVGYNLLAAIVEKISGQTFESYLRGHIFKPAHLLQTGWRPEWEDAELSRGYIESNGAEAGEVSLPPVPSWARLGSGSLTSTVEDLYRWSLALSGTQVLSPTAKASLFTPSADYSYGWWTTTTERGTTVNLAGGDWPGYQSWLARFPDEHAVIAFVLNNDAGWGSPIFEELQKALFSVPDPLPPNVIGVAPDLLRKYEGTYRFLSGASLKIELSNNHLIAIPTGQEALTALTGGTPARASRFESDNHLTAELIDNFSEGNFDWAKKITEFSSPVPLTRLRSFWETMLRVKGSLKRSTVVGTVAARGGTEQSYVTFDLDHGQETWTLFWHNNKLFGWDIDVGKPAVTRLFPIGNETFVAFDVLNLRAHRLAFEPGEMIGGRGLKIHLDTGLEIRTKRD